MRMVELPIVRALVVARIREIAWSPVRQLFFVVALQPIELGATIASGLEPSPIVWKVVHWLIAFQLGTLVGTASSPMGRDAFDFITKRPGFGRNVMAQLPASALERVAATSLLAVPMALPYVAGMLLSALLPYNSGLSAALHLALLVLGFGVQRAWTQLPSDRMPKWGIRQRSSLPIYGSPRGGEVSAVFWALAAQVAFVPFVLLAGLLFVGWFVPNVVSDFGADRAVLLLAGSASLSGIFALVMSAPFLPALAMSPLSRRSLAGAVLLLVVVLIAVAAVPLIAAAVFYYRTTEGVGAAARLMVTMAGFEALAAAGIARFATPKNLVAVGVLILAPLMMTLLTAASVAVFLPFLMPAVSALAAVAFALALLLVFTAPRAPLSREPAGVVGAALRLMGAA